MNYFRDLISDLLLARSCLCPWAFPARYISLLAPARASILGWLGCRYYLCFVIRWPECCSCLYYFFFCFHFSHTHSRKQWNSSGSCTSNWLTYFTIEWISCALLPPSAIVCVVFATVKCDVFLSAASYWLDVCVCVVCVCVGLLFSFSSNPRVFPRVSTVSVVPGSMYFRFVVKRALRVVCVCVCLLLRELMVKGCVWFCWSCS